MLKEVVADTLEQLWLSYNQIEKLKGISVMKKLKVGSCWRGLSRQILYLSNNKVKDWKEFEDLKGCPVLEDLLFVGNPLQEKHSADGGKRLQAS